VIDFQRLRFHNSRKVLILMRLGIDRVLADGSLRLGTQISLDNGSNLVRIEETTTILDVFSDLWGGACEQCVSRYPVAGTARLT
jgi:hypothetical protein